MIDSIKENNMETTLEPRWITTPTWYAKVYLSGDISVAKQVCRENCWRDGLCVTIEPCDYIYTGGQESGYCVGLINYPRFPSTPEAIIDRAKKLAILLLERTFQWYALIVTPNTTEWITVRKDK